MKKYLDLMNEIYETKKCIPQFNIVNLEWAKYILEECEKENSPVILGVSEGALEYMGGPNIAVGMVDGLIKDLNITIPVLLHLDHGTSIETCKRCVDAGFNSVMIDASKYDINENISITREVVDYAHQSNVLVEAEVGHVGGVEDNISATNLNATLEDCIKLVAETNVDSLAPAVGTAHGMYKGDPVIDFELIKKISENIQIPLVLHGCSGVKDEEIKKAIANGINKINIDTEIKTAWHKAIKEFINKNPDVYDSRKVIGSGEEAIKNTVSYKINVLRGKN